MIRSYILFLYVFSAISSVNAEDIAPFTQAIEPRAFHFPEDHGSHPGFETEWWYFTGNLKDEQGREFGYQFTIFRRGVDPRAPAERGRASKWAMGDAYIGHLAISDIGAKKFYFAEDAKRGVLDIAGASSREDKSVPASVRVWMANWEMQRTASGFSLKAESGTIGLNLNLAETIAPVLHGKPGEEGLSRKGARPGQASYYYSLPQLKTSGTISINGSTTQISSGLSWMDHEFGSNQLSDQQAGWDWFSIQLDDGSSLMLYLLRNKDGSLEPNSSGTWIEASGKATYLPLSTIKTTRGRKWRSSFSGGEYTLGWHIELPDQKVSLDLDAAQDDQEVRSTKTSRISYYEGAIRVKGIVGDKQVKGSGYLEITGPPGQKDGKGLGGML